MSWRAGGRRGVSTGDVMLGLAAAALMLSLAFPALRNRAFLARLDDAIVDIESLRRGAEGYLQQNRAWPPGSAPGVIPAELLGAFPGRSDLTTERYTLQWMRLEVVDAVEQPPAVNPQPIPLEIETGPLPPTIIHVPHAIGGIVLRTSDEELLGELLDRYRAEGAFVRDTTWTLLLPSRPEGA